jgi:ABC-2 type transport system ATP-binding protein
MAEIIIQNLHKQYRNGAYALNGINLKIDWGQFFTLLGPNGAGKSTLIKILTTLLQPDQGSFTVAGLHPQSQLTAIRKTIGVALQENAFDPTEKPEASLVFQGRLYGLGKKESLHRAHELMELFGLLPEKNKKNDALSGGNKRKLHCAMALVHQPKVLFLDEPTVGLDPVARDNFWNIITQLNQEKNITVFLTTQYLDEADQFASNMALIAEGKIRFAGSVNDFKNFVNPDKDSSLNDSYISYINKNFPQQKNTND